MNAGEDALSGLVKLVRERSFTEEDLFASGVNFDPVMVALPENSSLELLATSFVRYDQQLQMLATEISYLNP